jgi:hypothetical protein
MEGVLTPLSIATDPPLSLKSHNFGEVVAGKIPAPQIKQTSPMLLLRLYTIQVELRKAPYCSAKTRSMQGFQGAAQWLLPGFCAIFSRE